MWKCHIRHLSCHTRHVNTILVLALDGVMDSSLAITFDTVRTGLTLLSRGGKPHRVRLVVAGQTQYVRTSAGLRLKVDVTFAGLRKQTSRRPHWVIVPALGMTSDEAISARLAKSDAVAAMNLLRQLPPSVKIAASCSSVFLLAATGLLRGRDATTTWWLAHLFRARYPEVRLDETKMLVRDGSFMTAGSAYAQLDLMLAVVTDILGPGVAHLCARYLLIDQRPSQARYMIQSHMQHVDPAVIAAERWIDGNLSDPISIAAHTTNCQRPSPTTSPTGTSSAVVMPKEHATETATRSPTESLVRRRTRIPGNR